VELDTGRGVLWLISGQTFATQMFAYGANALWGEFTWFVGQLWRAFLGIGIGPGILGALLLLRQKRRLALPLVLMFASTTLFYIDYQVVDKETMFLPSYLIWALWAAVGFQKILDWVRPARQAGRRIAPAGVLKTAFVASVLVGLTVTWGQVDLSQDRSTRTLGEDMLRRVEPLGLVFGWWDTVPVIQYLQQVEGRRTDVAAVNRFLIEPQNMLQWIERSVSERPVYIDSPPPGLPPWLMARPAGNLYRITPRFPGSISFSGRE
jgi:hypothetical protein